VTGMRIERLDLLAYGAFDDHSLDLKGPGVHLVHGPNEAGKSTTLSALDQLLYGIDHNTRYAFRHGNRTRLGARLSAADGVALEIIRQKRRKDALVDADGTPLTEEALVPFLGGVDRKTFTTEFALNSEELRSGGELLAAGEGDMAQLLAAARSGMRLNAVLKKIEERQRALYLRQGRNPRINAGLGRLKAVRQDLRDATLRPEQYQDAEQAVAEAEQRLEAVTVELKGRQRLRDNKRELREKLPALARYHALEQQIEEIRAQGPIATDDIREELPNLIKLHGEHEAVRSRDTQALKRVDEQLTEARKDDSLLQYAAVIEQLTRDVTAILDVARQHEDSSAEATRTRARAEARLRTVHTHATLTDENLYRVPPTLLKRGQELRDQGRKRHDDLDHARDAVKRWRDKREQADKKLSALPVLEDVSQLRNAHSAVPADLLTKLVDTETKEKKLDRRFRQARNRLDFPEMEPAEVLNLRLPEREEVSEAENAFRSLDQREHERAAELDRDQRQMAAHRRELARLVSDDAPPTHGELHALRAQRDELLTKFLGDPSGDVPLQEAVKRADNTVDLMLRHAEQVNQRANLEREIADLEAVIPDHQAAIEILLAERETARRSWEELWEAWPTATPESAQASRVLVDFDKLKSDAHELQDIRIDLDEQRERLDAHTARLRQLLRLNDDDPQITASTAHASARLAEMMEMVGGRLREHEAVATDRTAAQHDLATAESELAEAESIVARVQEAVTVHDERWQRFLGDAGLPADRDLDTALADLESLLGVAADVESAAEAENIVNRSGQRMSEFSQLMENTLRTCDRSVPASISGWQQAVDTLAQDLQDQREDAQQRAGLLKNKSELAAAVAEADAELTGLRSRLEGFYARLGVSSLAELEATAARATELREKYTALANVRQTLPEGQELALIRQQAEQTSVQELGAKLDDLDEEICELEASKADWLERRTERRQMLEGLDGGGDAASAAADVAQICAELAEDAEEYLRLETARIAILACMEEYRTSDQEPVLARASEVFGELSRGRYVGLELSDDERPSIRAKSSTGALLAPQDLSEGTSDQLYLALRLATLERHAVAGDGLPIAVDDIFMTFDEQRTEAALRVLDGMADRFQVIVFTHHEYVIRSAAKELPEGRCHVHQLPD